MNISRTLKFLPALLFAAFMAACGGNDPENNGDGGKDIPTDEITSADFVGAWVDEEDPDCYIVLEADRTGSIVETGTNNGKPVTETIDFVWKYRNQTLTVDGEDFTVIKISKRAMTLMDEDGYEESYRRIKKSEVPGYEGDDDDDDQNDNPEVSSDDINTLGAEPSSYSAELNGKYSGKARPDSVGFEYSYFQDFPKEYTRRVLEKGKTGSFSLEATKIVDLATVYYRAVAMVKDNVICGETKKFKTLQGTYKIDGQEYKFIKVTGLASGSFSMMQTELPPNAEFEFGGKMRVLNDDKSNGLTKGETREFLNIDGPVILRYPSTAEWMYAATGGSQSAGYTYSGSDDIDAVAWYGSNSNDHAWPPARKAPNELGFYDMSGNYGELTAVYTDEEEEGWKDHVLRSITCVKNISAKYFQNMWGSVGHSSGAFGGSWDSKDYDCQTGSSVKVTSVNNTNTLDCSHYTLRLVYSRPD